MREYGVLMSSVSVC